jgi:hypothetical protein
MDRRGCRGNTGTSKGIIFMQNPETSGARGAPHLHKEQNCHNIQLFKARILYCTRPSKVACRSTQRRTHVARSSNHKGTFTVSECPGACGRNLNRRNFPRLRSYQSIDGCGPWGGAGRSARTMGKGRTKGREEPVTALVVDALGACIVQLAVWACRLVNHFIALDKFHRDRRDGDKHEGERHEEDRALRHFPLCSSSNILANQIDL